MPAVSIVSLHPAMASSSVAMPLHLPAMSSSSSSSFFPKPLLRLRALAPSVPRRRPVALAAADSSISSVVLVDKTEAHKPERLKNIYLEKVVPLLMEEFSHTNIHQVPKIEKIVVNCGMGDAQQNSKGLDAAMKDLAKITGQWPIKTKAKKSIASFKLREGNVVGMAVTLRGKVMYYFLDRLINMGFPRTRDFQGINPNSFDGHGNFSTGLEDQSALPEINPEIVTRKRGFDVSITTTAETDKEAQRMLALLGMPFRDSASDPTVVVRKKKRKAAHFTKKSKGRR